VRGSELVEALGDEYMVVGEAAEVLAVRLSRSLWNLRFVVASAGGESAGVAGVVMLWVLGRWRLAVRRERLCGELCLCLEVARAKCTCALDR
jgi:hypothetical protein